jgi:hypothetical protein
MTILRHPVEIRCRRLFKFQEAGGRNGNTEIIVYYAPSPQGGYAECGKMSMPKNVWESLSAILTNANSMSDFTDDLMVTKMELGENND